ncbi:MAG TPA: response regulator transcription factor [Urbifossiella sp.]|nr:response regulator transcription factor [Urbifossiella sp.]
MIAPSPVVSVLVADPHPITRRGVRAILATTTDLRVVAEAATGAEAVGLATGLRPDVVVCEAGLPDVGGADLVAWLRTAHPGGRVLVLTGRSIQGLAPALLAAGAAGVILKAAALEEFVRAVRVVAGGGAYLDPTADSTAGNAAPPAALSDREVEVMRLIAQGYSNKEIAARLRLSVKSVETYKARSLEKLGIRSRVALVRYGIDRGWLSGAVWDKPAAAPEILTATAIVTQKAG